MKFSKGDILVWKGIAEGAVAVCSYAGAARLMAHPMGGGFQHYVAGEASTGPRAVDKADRARALFRRARLALAGAGGRLEAWTHREGLERRGAGKRVGLFVGKRQGFVDFAGSIGVVL